MNTSRNHLECGDTRSRLYERDTPKGILWYCHNCGKGGLKFKDGLTPKEVIRLCTPIEEEQVEGIVTLPKDITYLLPIEALAWLWKYDLDQYEIDTMRCCYSPSMNRLILPVYKGVAGAADELVYWQGRTLGEPSKKNPKYINSRKKKGEDCYFKAMYGAPYPHASICIVEDIVSAVKVSRACDCLALLGSYIPTNLIRYIVAYDKILIWLDYDKQKESIQFSKRLRELTGKDIRCIITEQDPKEYSTEEIERYVFA